MKIHKLCAPISASLLLGLWLTALCFGQTITATVTGAVTDPTGAIVPNAIVTVTSAETKLSKTATTDDAGRYTVPYLNPGVYDITVEGSGFKRALRAGVRLEVAQTAQLDFTLTAGQVSETVEVSGASSPLLITESSNLEATIENKLIEDLPSAERSTLAFINQVPGAIDGGFALARGEALNTNANGQGPIGSSGNRNFFDANFSVSGGQAASNDVLLDGVSNTLGDFGGIAISPPQDSVREFKVISGAIPAEYGRTGGAVVNMITKAGTSDFHGAIYEYFQNGGLNANGWQRNRAGRLANGAEVLPRIPLKRNQYGGAIGGPVWLPRKFFGPLRYDGRQATFFFFNYEGRRERNPFSQELTLPTEKMRGGDLSELLGAPRAGLTNPDGSPALFGQIYNPYGQLVNGSRQPIPGNRLDLLPVCGPGARAAACLDPVALNLFKFLPLPNRPGLTDNFVFSGTAPFKRDIYAARIDQTISERQSFFGRFSNEKRQQINPNYFGTPAANGRNVIDTFYNVTFNHLYSFTNSIVNNFRYGNTRARGNQLPDSIGFDPTLLGLPAYLRDTAAELLFPRFNFAGGPQGQGIAGEITGGAITSGGNNQPRDTQTFADAVTFIRGAHTIKAGGEYRLLRYYPFGFNETTGTFNFNRTFTRGPVPGVTPINAAEAGSSLASLLLGLPASGLRAAVVPLTVYHHYVAGFVQDDFKVTTRLTLNLGLRYDYESGTAESHGQMTNFDTLAASHLRGRVGAPSDPFVRALRPDFANLRGLLSFVDGAASEESKRRFAPRLGFAYRVNDRTSARGGYALFYVPLTVEPEPAQGSFFNTDLTQSPNNAQVVQPGGAAAPTVFLTDPFPTGVPQPPGRTLGADTQIGETVVAFEPRQRTSYVQQWNLVVQRELARNLVLDIGYVGNHGVRLPISEINLNQLSPADLAYARENFAAAGAANVTAFFNQQVPNPFFGVITNPRSALRTATVARLQLLRPFPQYTNVTLFRPRIGASSYHALQTNLQKRFSDGLSATANYTFSKLLDLNLGAVRAIVGPGGGIENIYDISDDYGLSGFDVPHRLVVSFSYELPFGRGKRFGRNWGGFVQTLLGDWQTSGAITYQSGAPIPLSAAGFPVAVGVGIRRPDRVSGVEAGISLDEARENVRQGGVWFNPAAFAQPADYVFGNAARFYADVRRDPYRNANLSVMKNFRFREDRHKLQFRAEFLNAFNQVVFGTPAGNVNTPATFGRVTTQGNIPRIIQFVLRYTF